jgi:uncharacterized protein (UPF0335 family)
MSNIEGVSGNQLRQIITKIERLEEDKAAILTDIRAVYNEAKSNGFDSKIIRVIIRLRKMDKAELEEQEELIDLYKQALGMAE